MENYLPRILNYTTCMYDEQITIVGWFDGCIAKIFSNHFMTARLERGEQHWYDIFFSIWDDLFAQTRSFVNM